LTLGARINGKFRFSGGFAGALRRFERQQPRERRRLHNRLLSICSRADG